MRKPPATRDHVINAIRQAAKVLGHTPALEEFIGLRLCARRAVYRVFDSWTAAVRAADLDPHTSPRRIPDERLLADWARVARRLRRVPRQLDYQRRGRFSAALLCARFRRWSDLPAIFLRRAEADPRSTDVVNIILRQHTTRARYAVSGRRLANRIVFGRPMPHPCFRYEPVNEQGVVLLFGMMARELGFVVEAAQPGFPDCEALRQVADGQWQRVRIEFEFHSRAFVDHGHDADDCDVIVCWKHNWTACPERMEVVELSKRLSGDAAAGCGGGTGTRRCTTARQPNRA